MSTYILLSGFDKDGFYDTVANELKSAITDTKSILFVASNPNNFEKIDNYTPRIFGFFNKIGVNFDCYAALDKRMPDGEQKNAVENASCVFLMGGETLTQFEYLKRQNLIGPLMKHGGVIIGLSAGAINMGKRSVIANPAYPPVKIFDGIGLVDITVVPHFGGINEDYIKTEIFPLTYESAIYGMYNNAVFVVRGGIIKYSGTIYKLSQGRIVLMSN